MDYTKTVESYGRQETKIDLERFTADLAKELGGKVWKDPERDIDQTHIVLGTERLDLVSNTWKLKARVRVTIWAPDVKHDERGYYGDKRMRTEEATVDPNKRTVAAIAKDVKRRVVDGSREALRLQREYADTVRRGRADIKKHAEQLRRATGLDVTVNETERSARVYWNGDGLYISGTLSADATVSIDRVGSMPLEKFEKMMWVLKGGN